MTLSTPEKTVYLLEEPQVFSQSLLWELQRQYFIEKGVAAWRQGEVPHYVTSNPTIANCYAELVFAFWRDQQTLTPISGATQQPLYVCELGGGSGRFAFYFLTRLAQICDQAGVALTQFRYVLTGLVERILEFWGGHPRFQRFVKQGSIASALFYAAESAQLDLQLSQQTPAAGSLERPLVVIANYLFDSLPQDLFYLADHACYQGLVSLLMEEDPAPLSATEILARIRVGYDHQPLADSSALEPNLQAILERYRESLDDTYLLLPTLGLRCLERLKGFSKRGLLVLSADKGDDRLEAYYHQPPPGLVRHGCFSLNVNYHAFKVFCEQSGGLALFPGHPYRLFNLAGLLLVDQPAQYRETQRAYQHYVREFSPDDFCTLAKEARQHSAGMSVAEILAYIRLSYYDSHQFAHYLPRLEELAPSLPFDEWQAVKTTVERVWEMYFPLGEAQDLAYQIGCLLYEMDEYALALVYFKHSLEIYGEHLGTLYNMAACYQLLEQHAQAEPLLRKVLQQEPDNTQALKLFAKYEVKA